MVKQEFKSYRAEVKAASDGDAGVVEALVSVFGNIDLGGDRVMPGAFSKSLARWASTGDPIPFIWSHEWDNPDAHIGYVEQAEERPEGLWVRARLDIDRPFAEQVFHLMKTRRVTQFSFGYTVEDSSIVTDPDGTPVRELKEVDVFEVGPTLMGMNPATRLLQAASALTDLEPGADISAKTEELIRSAHDALARVLTGLTSDADDVDAKDATDVLDASAIAQDSAPLDDADTAPRDSGATIDPEQVLDLLVRTRHSEE